MIVLGAMSAFKEMVGLFFVFLFLPLPSPSLTASGFFFLLIHWLFNFGTVSCDDNSQLTYYCVKIHVHLCDGQLGTVTKIRISAARLIKASWMIGVLESGSTIMRDAIILILAC